MTLPLTKWREVVQEIDNAKLAKQVRNQIDAETAAHPHEPEDRNVTIDLEVEEALVTVKKAAKATE